MFGKLADLWVEVGTKDETARGLGALRGKLSGWAGETGRSLVGGIWGPLAGAVGTAAVGKFLYDATQKAGDLAETLDKVRIVFGGSQNGVLKFAQDMADQFGLVKREVLDAAGAFGLILRGSGMGQGPAAELSVILAKTAADASSLYNVSLPEALEKIRSGLVGEAEPLRAFGVLLSEGAVKAKAAAMGYTELTESAKAMARAQLIVEGLAVANNNLADTSDSLANRQRKLAGDWENLQADLGTALIPAFQKLIDVVYDLGGALNGAFGNDRQAQVRALGEAIKGAATNVSFSVGGSGGGAVDPNDLLFGGLLGNNMFTRGISEGGLTFTNSLFGVGGDRLRRIQAAKVQPESKPTTQPTPTPTQQPPSPGVPNKPKVDPFEMMAEWFNLGADIEVARARLRNRDALDRAEGKLADLAQARADRLAQGGVLGDQTSAVSSLQNEILNDLPRQQLKRAEDQLAELKAIRGLLEDGGPTADEAAGLVLAGPE